MDIAAALPLRLVIDIAAIEDQYLAGNVATLKKLARTVGRWQQELDRVGIPNVLVEAQKWQTAVLHVTHKAKRVDRKVAAKVYCRTMFGQDLDEDRADSACIAAYLAQVHLTGAAADPAD